MMLTNCVVDQEIYLQFHGPYVLFRMLSTVQWNPNSREKQDWEPIQYYD